MGKKSDRGGKERRQECLGFGKEFGAVFETCPGRGKDENGGEIRQSYFFFLPQRSKKLNSLPPNLISHHCKKNGGQMNERRK